VSSRASAGGAAGARGSGYQDRVLAWMAAHLVAGEALPDLVPGVVVRVGAQTRQPVDDVGATTEDGGWVLIQAKAGLGLGETADSALAKAIDQVVEQYHAGVPAGGSARRPLVPGCDVLVIATDAAAPHAVRTHLAHAARRVGTDPADSSLMSAAVNQDEVHPLEALLTHVRRAWKEQKGEEPGDDAVRGLCRVLRIVPVDLDGGAQQLAAEQLLRNVLVDPTRAGTAWPDLETYAHGLAEDRRWGDREDAEAFLRSAGHPVGPVPALLNDVNQLESWTQSNLDSLAAADALAVGPDAIRLPRAVDTELAGLRGNLIVVGDPGCGKTGAVVRFARQARSDGRTVVWLSALDLSGASPTGLQLGRPLHEVLRGWTGDGPATLVVDGLDADRGSGDHTRFSTFVGRLTGSRWHVVATVRLWDARHSTALRDAFSGAPLSTDATRRHAALSGVTHVLVGDLVDAEMTSLAEELPELASILAVADPRLAPLLRNPFNLQLAASILASAGPAGDLAAVGTRLDLLRLYWDQRVGGDAGEGARLLRRISLQMLGDRRLVITAPGATDSPADLETLDRLLRSGVLRERPTPLISAVRAVEFSHNVLFDFAVAVTVLADPLDPLSAATAVDGDPALPLIARPSLDMHFGNLWAHERPWFWTLLLHFAGSDDRLLASLAGTAFLAAARPAAADLEPLSDGALGADGDRGPARAVLRQAIGVLGATILPSQLARKALPGFASVARAAAAHARQAPEDTEAAGIALELVRATERLRDTSDTALAAQSARALADLATAARAMPATYEDFARHMAQLLPAVAGIEPDAAAALRETMDPAVTAVWGVTALDRYADQIHTIAAFDTDLALLVVARLWSYEEVRDERTHALSTPLLGMTSTRQQDLRMARWHVGHRFPEICALDPVAAARIFAQVVGHDPAAAEDGTERRWPISYGTATGWLDDDNRYDRHADHGATDAMASALIQCLTKLAGDPDVFDQCLGVIVQEVSDAAFWQQLLEAASADAGLAARLVPLLDTGSLLAYWNTRAAAARCLATVSRTDDAAVPAAIEAMRRRLQAAGTIYGRPDDAVDEVLRVCAPDDRSGPGTDVPPGPVEERAPGSALERLTREVNATEGAGSAATPARWPELRRLLVEADSEAGDGGESPNQDMLMIMTRAAAVLAADPDVVPGSAVGALVHRLAVNADHHRPGDR
jgi:hypothetical protein